jgi:1-phosphofructokinase/tagatose 6-phosphate kinase
MFLVVCLNPTLQKTVFLPDLRENEVNRAEVHFTDASGKGVNVARVLSQLGEQAVHLTHAGGQLRSLFTELAERSGVRVEAVPVRSEVRFCYTLLSKTRGTTTEIVEEAEPVESGAESEVLAAFRQLLPQAHTVIVSGSKAAGYTNDIFPEMTRLTREAGARIVLDYRGKDLQRSLPHRPDIIKPNFSEFCATFLGMTGVSEQTEDQSLLEKVRCRMRELHDEFGCQPVITRGKFSTLFLEGETVAEVFPESIRPVNTIGCGDAFSAGLASALHRGDSLRAAIQHAGEVARRCALNPRPGWIEGT